MATQEEIIAQQRVQLEAARKQAEELKKAQDISTRRELIKRTLIQKARAQAQQKVQRQAGIKQAQQIRVAEQKFETQVAQIAPGKAKQQYLEKAYQTAKKTISGKLAGVTSSLARARANLKRARERGVDDIRQEGKVEALESKQRTYLGALKGSKESLIKGHFTGAIVGGAQFESQKIRSQFEQEIAKEIWKKEQIAIQKIPPTTVPGIVSPALVKQVRGTYDPKTGIYIDPSGAGFSMREAPPGAKIVGAPPTAIPDIFKPTTFMPPEFEKPFVEARKQAKIQKVQLEQYKDMGYSSRQAEKLAEAGWEQKVSFTPEGARQEIKRQRLEPVKTFVGEKIQDIRAVKEFERAHPDEIYDPRTGMFIKPTYGPGVMGTGIMVPPTMEEQLMIQAPIEREKEIREKIREKRIKVGADIVEIPILEKEIKIPTFMGGGIGTGLTIGQVAALPVKGVKEVAKFTAKEWKLRYQQWLNKQYGKKDLKNVPGRWIGGEFEIRPKYGSKEWDKGIREGKVIPLAAEKVGSGIEMFVEFAPYAVLPTAGVYAYGGSRIAETTEEFKGAEKESIKVVDTEWSQYKKDIELAKKDLEEGYELGGVLTKEEFYSERVPVLTKDIQSQAALEITGEVAFLGAIGARKLYQFGKQRIITKVPIRVLKKEATKFIEIKKFIRDGKKKEFVKYEIFGEKRPPILVTETTRFRKLLGIKPIKVKEIPAIKYRQLSWDPLGQFRPKKLKIGEKWVPAKEPSLSITFETSKKYGTVYKVEGEVIPRTADDFAKLTKREKWEWQKLAESASGRAVHEDMVFKILKKESIKLKGDTLVERLYRLKKIKGGIAVTTPWIPGKAITRAETVTEVIKFGETRAARVFRLREITKDVTMPFARRAGEVRKAKGLIVEYEPIFLESKEGIGVIAPKVIKKTPFADTFQIQKVTTKFDIKLPPPPKVSKLPTPKIIVKTKEDLVGIPRMVGGVGEVASEYLGKGMYERVEVISVVKPSIISDVKVDVTPVQVPTQRLLISPVQKPLQVTIQKPLQVTIQKPLQIQPVAITSVQIPTQVVTQLQAITPIQISLQRPVQLKVQKPVTRLITEPSVRPKIPQIPKRPRIRIPIRLPERGMPKRKRIPLRKPVPERGYTYEIRRKGKWERAKMPFAFATKIGAESAAQEKVLKEAAASYRLVKSKKGKKVVRSRKKLSPYRKVLFRKSKKEPGVMIQKKLLRILTPGEKKEISYAGVLARTRKTKTTFKFTKDPKFKKKSLILSKKKTKKSKKKKKKK